MKRANAKEPRWKVKNEVQSRRNKRRGCEDAKDSEVARFEERTGMPGTSTSPSFALAGPWDAKNDTERNSSRAVIDEASRPRGLISSRRM